MKKLIPIILISILIPVFAQAGILEWWNNLINPQSQENLAATLLKPIQGGTGQNTSNWTGYTYITAGVWGTSTPASGGGSTTTINGVSGPTFTFNTSTAGFSISTSTGIVTFGFTESDPFSATKALNNLASVAINTSLVSDTDSTDNLGSSTIAWLNTYTDNLILPNTNSITLKTPTNNELEIELQNALTNTLSIILDSRDVGIYNTSGGANNAVIDFYTWGTVSYEKDLELRNSAGGASPAVGVSMPKGLMIKNNIIATDAFDTNYINLQSYDGAAFQTAAQLIGGRIDLGRTGSVIPVTDSTYNLGASTPKYFANAYLDKLYLNSTAALDGATAGLVNITGNVSISGNITTGTWQGTPVAYNYGGTGTTTALALQYLWWGDGSGNLVQVASSTLAGTASGVSSLNTLTGALTIWGTANRLTVSASGTAGLLLTIPQDIHTGASPSFAGINLGNTGLHLADTDDSHDLVIQPLSDFTLQRTLGISTGDSDRTITLSGNPTLADWFNQTVKSTASPTFAGLTLTGALTASTTLTGPAYLTAGVLGTSTIAFTYLSGAATDAQIPNDITITDNATTGVATLSSLVSIGAITTGSWHGTTIAEDHGGTGVANLAGHTLTVAGPFSTIGHYTLDLTTTGNTALTLPTTGTLVNSAVATLSSLTSIGTIATGTWQGTDIDIGDYTNLAAGRSLTLSGDSVELDAEIYGKDISISIYNASDTMDAIVQKSFSYPITITEVECSTNASASSTIQFDERAYATPNTGGTDVLTAALVCGATSASSSAFANATIAANGPLSLDIDTITGTVSALRIHIFYQIDD